LTINYTIAIPARNEELVIEATANALLSKIGDQADVEILVIDNQSTDGTWNKLEQLASQSTRFRYEKSAPRPGYGVAIQCAIRQARGRYLVIVMADGSESPEDVKRFIDASRANPDCAVFGNRFARSSKVSGYPLFKRIVNRFANLALSVLGGKKLADLTNGFKLYPLMHIQDVAGTLDDGFSSTIQLALSVALKDIRIITVPHDWHGRVAGKSKFSLTQEAIPYLKAALGMIFSPNRNNGRV
jgi:dolichol-phosphate mannosyltransferase